MDCLTQPLGTSNPSGPSPVNLELLLDTLAALADEIGELPDSLPLLASELEVGLAETLGVAGDGC